MTALPVLAGQGTQPSRRALYGHFQCLGQKVKTGLLPFA
ncbi:hypothetical protein LHK_01313 [Laribacter hongkongensis HLHK9]|uniref:Uncharacterized protein n=1 Tax=Laribacter hongkongensis (strain HLHK9) TaxID=557598 RepID=C1D763_LARHH|nr:hypothetical protein LHK_01313 [Laribacter hongkongensis HLHK9]